jgi:hypothetical protein
MQADDMTVALDAMKQRASPLPSLGRRSVRSQQNVNALLIDIVLLKKRR